MNIPHGNAAPVWGQPMPRRPGTLTAAGVLAFVSAGIEIIGGLIWLAGGAMVGAAGGLCFSLAVLIMALLVAPASRSFVRSMGGRTF